MPNRLPILLLVIALSAGCAAAADAGAAGPLAADEGSDASQGGNGAIAPGSGLFDRDIEGAQIEFESRLEVDPTDGNAAAGAAITGALLVPYMSSTTTVLTRHLGASSSLDTQGDVIYGERGFFYFLARGVPWEDGQSTAGIKTLLIDQLPWRRTQLDSIDGFVSGLSRPVSLLAQDLVRVADDLESIDENLQTAIDDEQFVTFALPGTVFHDESLDIVFGKSELSAMRAGIAGLRSAIYFFGAYAHDWTLERGFGESVWREVAEDPMHEEHVEGYRVIDYQLDHMNESLGRTIENANLLSQAGAAFQTMTDALVRSIEFGLAETAETALVWSGADAATATDVIEFVVAVGDAVDGPTELPFTEPSQTLDLQPVFKDGLTVPDETNLLTLETYEGEFGETVDEVAVDEETLNTVTESVFDPPPGTEPAPELLIGEDIDRLFDTVTTDVANDYDRTVSGSF